jgi:hypothetical protein
MPLGLTKFKDELTLLKDPYSNRMAKNTLFNLQGPPEIDTSTLGWLINIYTVLHWPITALSVVGLLVLGVFVESAPRKSLAFLDNTLGSITFFLLPIILSVLLDWPTGLLAATVSLIVFARLQKEDISEGFSDTFDDTTEQNTKVISGNHRWFVEKILGERPIAISSDRVITSAVQDNNVRGLTHRSDSLFLPSISNRSDPVSLSSISNRSDPVSLSSISNRSDPVSNSSSSNK